MHNRFCHLHVAGKGNFFCNACAIGKAHDAKASYPRKSKRGRKITKVGQLIHTDVAGPFPKSVNAGNQYACVFLDDFSETKWVYFMKTKGQTVDALDWLSTLLKRESLRIWMRWSKM